MTKLKTWDDFRRTAATTPYKCVCCGVIIPFMDGLVHFDRYDRPSCDFCQNCTNEGHSPYEYYRLSHGGQEPSRQEPSGQEPT